jgi:hypothetical protein
MPRRGTRILFRGSTLLLGSLGLLATTGALPSAAPAAADEAPAQPAPTYGDLKALHEAARKSKDWTQVEALVPRLVTAAAEGKDERDVQDLLAVLQRHLTYGTEALQVAAVNGLGRLAKPGTSAYLRPLLIGDRARRRPIALRKAAIDAWARIRDKGAHELLLDLMRTPSSKEEDLDVALCAAAAYRQFKDAPRRERFVLWKDFLMAYQNVYDSNATYVSGSAQTWWASMNAPMLATFNHLTDQKFKTLAQCADWWRDNKDRIQRERDPRERE